MSPSRSDKEPKNFDIKPRGSAPSPTSKPIIVGHHPVMPDPMLQRPLPPKNPIKIDVTDTIEGHPAQSPEPETKQEPKPQPEPEKVPIMPVITPVDSPASDPNVTVVPEESTPTPIAASSDEESIAEAPKAAPAVKPNTTSDLRVHLPAGQAAHKKSRLAWVVLALAAVVGLAVGYLVIK